MNQQNEGKGVVTPETLRSHIHNLLATINSEPMQKRLQFTPNEKVLVTWVLTKHGVALLDEAIEKVGEYMFGGLPLRIRLFVVAGQTTKNKVDDSKVDKNYVEGCVYALLGDLATHLRRPSGSWRENWSANETS